MGVENLFEKGNLGDFAENVSLDDITHKAAIRFDEDTTTVVASAVDATTTESTNRPNYIKNPNIASFIADQPFIFSINDRIFNEVLFAGVYRGPN